MRSPWARGIDLIILDDAQLLWTSVENGAYYNIRPLAPIISELDRLAKSHQCAVLVIASPDRENSEMSVKQTSTSDTLGIAELVDASCAAMVLQRVLAPVKKMQQQSVPVEIEIVKNEGGPCGTMKLQFDVGTMKFSTAPK